MKPESLRPDYGACIYFVLQGSRGEEEKGPLRLADKGDGAGTAGHVDPSAGLPQTWATHLTLSRESLTCDTGTHSTESLPKSYEARYLKE